MFEVFGKVNYRKSDTPRLTNPFDNLEIFKQFEFDQTILRSANTLFYIMFDKVKPEIYSDEKVQLVVYGKCYTPLNNPRYNDNKQLTANDLTKLYLAEGEMFIQNIKGSFTVIINDLSINNTLIFTDPLNVKNLYYTDYQNQIVLSSSLTALCNHLTSNGCELHIDEQSLVEYLLFNIVLEDRTLIKDIHELQPGTFIEINKSKFQIHKYFNVFENILVSGPKLTEKESVKQLMKTFADNVKMYSEGPNNTSVAITGGYDSRTVLSALGKECDQYEYFSYGLENSWDISVPQKISKKLNLTYNPIFFNHNFINGYSDYGETAVLLGDGMGEISQANIVYVYANNFKNKTSILTGLFGSELIKNPTSIGYFINSNVHDLLFADKIAETLNLIGKKASAEGLLSSEMFNNHKMNILKAIDVNPYMTNDLPSNKKLFYYLLMVGMRKYFMKEIKIQKNWVDNLHPFFDMDFILKLMETPFPWVYNWTQKKNLVNNLSIHKLYAYLINANPTLSNIISTHGFKPKYLLRKIYLPLLILEYFKNKKRISKQSAFNLNDLLDKDKHYRSKELEQVASVFFKSILTNNTIDRKAISKIVSLQLWFKSLGLSI